MKVTRFYTGEDGRTHFEDLEMPVTVQQGLFGKRSRSIPATGLLFRQSNADAHNLELHPAPRRQLILCLSGEVEIENGMGEKRRFRAGDVYLADDLTGEGHIHRELAGPVLHAWVFIPQDFDLDAWRA